MSNDPNEALRHHVSGAIERGEAEPIIGLPAVHRVNTTRSRLTCDCCDWRWDTQAELDEHVAYMNRYDTGEDYDMLADWWTVSRCPACGDPIDYCQGHGLIGDPVGHLTLQAHDKGRHEWCNAFGCEEVRLGK